ncbi:hypothetical protein KP509_24G064000 [Ceratopteris richardii]|uniref:FHA domain-containing protein n=1 Tax=Ceratopteris richardii TaxID=49495 RepID=A0A8T2RXN7_CERRI|nr:hypothetical protein KP509_24G064000 [Ceratopteris richardii]
MKNIPGELEAGFAKLQGEDFEYYMQTYSIVLGRNSKKSAVDVDLAGLGGGMNISRQHARIFYDFDTKRFALEVLGKNGCHVEGILYHPGTPPVKLDSQYLLQIGDKKFYFLLPIRSILRHPSATTTPSLHTYSSPAIPSHTPLVMPTIAPTPIPLPMNMSVPMSMHLPPTIPGSSSRKRQTSKATTSVFINELSPLMMKNDDFFQQPPSKRSRGQKKYEHVELKASAWLSQDATSAFMMPKTHSRQSMIFHAEHGLEPRRPAEATAQALPMQAEEKEVVSAVATVLSDSCGPGQWMSMPDLHLELFHQYSSRWPVQRVRKFLTADEFDGANKNRPWAGLLVLLKKYPEHFVITTSTKGRVTSEFVSLVSLLS